MVEMQTLSEASLVRQHLQQLGDERSPLHRVAHLLELVANNSVGLGEVLQDFARQTSLEARELIRAAQRAGLGMPSADDIMMLRKAHGIVKTAKTVLGQTPAAMQRNRAETIGDKEKLSRSDVQQAVHAFARLPVIERLLQSEDSGEAMAALFAPAEPAAAQAAAQPVAVHH